MNDNGDGTFSITGQYDEKQIGKGGSFISKTPSLPLVTSANARIKTSPSRVLQPRLPKYLERDSFSSPQADPTPSAKDESDLDSQGDGLNSHRRSKRLFFNVRRSENGKGVATLVRGSEDDEPSTSAVSHLRSRPPPRSIANGVGDSTGTQAKSQFDRSVISTSLISAGQVLPNADTLEMEDWEIAPGRIRAEASDTPDSKFPFPSQLNDGQKHPANRLFPPPPQTLPSQRPTYRLARAYRSAAASRFALT